MSEAKKRRKTRGAEFKGKVGLEAVRGVKTFNEIAQEHGVQPVMVGRWRREILAHAGTLFDGKRGPKPQEPHESADRLYCEIGRLKTKLDWLKKARAMNAVDRMRCIEQSDTVSPFALHCELGKR